MFLQKLFQAPAKTPALRPTSLVRTPAFRKFSTGQMKPPSSGIGLGPMMAMGGALAGFAYLTYQIRDMNSNKMKYMAEGHTYMSPLVQKRLCHTLGYFGYGIMSSAGLIYAMRNSMVWAAIPWWGYIPITLGLMYGCHAIDYQTMYPLKLACYTAFTGFIGLNILPLIQISAASAVADAALATGLSMSTLACIAYNAPSEQFLAYGGVLGVASMGMFAAGIGSIMFPASRMLHNIWLYGGLGLTSMFTLYHTQAIIHQAKTTQNYDPIGNAIGIYMNAVNMFIRFLMIFNGSKRK